LFDGSPQCILVAAFWPKVSMQRLVRHTRGGRLVAQAMALLFALVATLGSMAHASEGTHHTHAGERVSVSVADVEASDRHHDSQAPISERDVDKATHPCCADLQCHVGTAVLTTSSMTSPSLLEAERFYTPNYGRQSSLLSPLDRPPRTTVHT
jgi:hypothetical protein